MTHMADSTPKTHERGEMGEREDTEEMDLMNSSDDLDGADGETVFSPHFTSRIANMLNGETGRTEGNEGSEAMGRMEDEKARDSLFSFSNRHSSDNKYRRLSVLTQQPRPTLQSHSLDSLQSNDDDMRVDCDDLRGEEDRGGVRKVRFSEVDDVRLIGTSPIRITGNSSPIFTPTSPTLSPTASRLGFGLVPFMALGSIPTLAPIQVQGLEEVSGFDPEKLFPTPVEDSSSWSFLDDLGKNEAHTLSSHPRNHTLSHTHLHAHNSTIPHTFNPTHIRAHSHPNTHLHSQCNAHTQAHTHPNIPVLDIRQVKRGVDRVAVCGRKRAGERGAERGGGRGRGRGELGPVTQTHGGSCDRGPYYFEGCNSGSMDTVDCSMLQSIILAINDNESEGLKEGCGESGRSVTPFMYTDNGQPLPRQLTAADRMDHSLTEKEERKSGLTNFRFVSFDEQN